MPRQGLSWWVFRPASSTRSPFGRPPASSIVRSWIVTRASCVYHSTRRLNAARRMATCARMDTPRRTPCRIGWTHGGVGPWIELLARSQHRRVGRLGLWAASRLSGCAWVSRRAEGARHSGRVRRRKRRCQRRCPAVPPTSLLQNEVPLMTTFERCGPHRARERPDDGGDVAPRQPPT